MTIKHIIITLFAIIALSLSVACDPPQEGDQQVPPAPPGEMPGEAPDGYQQPGVPGGQDGYGQPDPPQQPEGY
ncbi:hypothetical protein [Desulfonatronovibrio magnus]|uniref:hypothetical protein n=1 Tax=Desulfonatronovibrio magnus TaxID=698827 RepID=UPI0005EADA54|nr:hypothetical protein [Desulfonatronovibrio magnus]